ncbi:hypothetical protein [Nitrospirillum iridis]|uniref:Uncharacterized protein n=1 Tax=Nitrospirillum iridis TaxID=765888 RepID=A0A7X0AWH8_9PROT|nr:hypothetical protein [Nitrospirillum iridis]MBB6250997.1 hypothetical protein [Nitrospirillum iridis]
MAEHAVFALAQSDLSGFLFADIGVEDSGMPLRVISALARLGLDPWQEAGRLAGLPQPDALNELAGLIATMPLSRWSLADARSIAARLVLLLPKRNSGPSLVVMRTRLNRRQMIFAVVAAAMIIAGAVFLIAAPDNATGPPPTSPAQDHPDTGN